MEGAQTAPQGQCVPLSGTPLPSHPNDLPTSFRGVDRGHSGDSVKTVWTVSAKGVEWLESR